MDFHLTKKIPERETDIPQPLPLSSSQPKNPKSISNGTLKRHRHDHNPPPHVVAVELTYKECLKNHAASMGGHALDGCGEFMPSPAAIPTDPTSLKCAACGCHRNFHRREPDEFTAHFHHLQLPPLLPQPLRSSTSPTSPPSPPLQPQPSSYYSSAPHMLLALRTGSSGPLDDHDHHHHQPNEINPTALVKSEKTGSGRKRVRTKFSQEQKEKMYSFSEQLGWKMSKCDEGLVEKFCNEAGVGKSVLKVWMHNNKNTFGKIRDILNNNNNNNNNNHSNGHNGNDNNGGSTTSLSFDTINGTHNTINGNSNNIHHHDSHDNEVGNVHLNVSADGSSSSS